MGHELCIRVTVFQPRSNQHILIVPFPFHSNVDECEPNPASNITVDLMKKMLPEYIVNCLLSSGHDEMSVICTLDVSDHPDNGIAKVESFINRRFLNDPNHNPTSLAPFEFPPGHQENSKFR